jgi:hypothetical protein
VRVVNLTLDDALAHQGNNIYEGGYDECVFLWDTLDNLRDDVLRQGITFEYPAAPVSRESFYANKDEYDLLDVLHFWQYGEVASEHLFNAPYEADVNMTIVDLVATYREDWPIEFTVFKMCLSREFLDSSFPEPVGTWADEGDSDVALW